MYFNQIEEIAKYILNLKQRLILIYALNGTGKSRLTRKLATSDKTFIKFDEFIEKLINWEHIIEDNKVIHRLKYKLDPKDYALLKQINIQEIIEYYFHFFFQKYEFFIEYSLKEDSIIFTFKKYLWTSFTVVSKKYPAVSGDIKTGEIKFIKEGEKIPNGSVYSDPLHLSMGETHIFKICIFFLYLNVIIHNADTLHYIIIDDLINSIDENYTYIIVSLLKDHIKLLLKNNHKVIILTHQKDFFNQMLLFKAKKSSFFMIKQDGIMPFISTQKIQAVFKLYYYLFDFRENEKIYINQIMSYLFDKSGKKNIANIREIFIKKKYRHQYKNNIFDSSHILKEEELIQVKKLHNDIISIPNILKKEKNNRIYHIKSKELLKIFYDTDFLKVDSFENYIKAMIYTIDYSRFCLQEVYRADPTHILLFNKAWDEIKNYKGGFSNYIPISYCATIRQLLESFAIIYDFQNNIKRFLNTLIEDKIEINTLMEFIHSNTHAQQTNRENYISSNMVNKFTDLLDKINKKYMNNNKKDSIV